MQVQQSHPNIVAMVIFPILAAFAVYVEYVHAFQSGLVDDLQSNYCVSPTPYGLASTGLTFLDDLFCSLIAFFKIAITNHISSVTLTYFLGNFLVPAIFVLIEPCRRTASPSHRSPPLYPFLWSMITGLLYQAVSTGLTMSIYWLIFIWSSRHRMRTHMGVSRVDAEAILVSIGLGMVAPTLAMMVLSDASVMITALWQFFPVAVWVIQSSYTRFVVSSSSPKHIQSGATIIQSLYALLFLLCFSIHSTVVYPIITDPAAMKSILIPSLTNLPPTATMVDRITHFLKWDSTMGLFSTMLGSLWFAADLKEVLRVLSWYVIAIPLVGPGAALAAVALWREKLLESGKDWAEDGNHIKNQSIS